MPARIIATAFALIAFAAAIVVGLAVGLDSDTILFRALVTMITCLAIGRALGAVAQQVIDDHIEQHKRRRPIPSQDDLDAAANPSPAATSQPNHSFHATSRQAA